MTLCRLQTLSAAAAALLLSATTANAQAGPPEGLLVVAHGAGPEWNDAVRATVAQVRWAGPMAIAFLMGDDAATQGWDSAVTRLVAAGASRIVVVPLMVSTHGSHYRQVAHYAGLLAALPEEVATHAHHVRPSPVPMALAPALDAAPELAVALADRWRALDAADRARPVLLVAHGPTSDEDAARWLAALEAVGARLREVGLARDFRVGLLRDDAPAAVRAAAVAALRDTVVALATGAADSVVVLPVLIASSSITRARIPGDLAGMPVRYAPVPLAPHPALARWIERVAREAQSETGTR